MDYCTMFWTHFSKGKTLVPLPPAKVATPLSFKLRWKEEKVRKVDGRATRDRDNNVWRANRDEVLQLHTHIHADEEEEMKRR
jgi:hypothetical protein